MLLKSAKLACCSLVVVVSAGILSCHHRSIPYIGPPDSSAVGTYELVFCRQLCKMDDSGVAIIRGTLVLDSARIVIPDSQKEYFAFANEGYWATDLRHDHPESACFVLREPGRPPSSFKGRPFVREGLPAVALTNWRYTQDTIGLEFELYRSADASFGVEAQLSGGLLLGTASSGGMLHETDFGVRYVVGKRVGAPRPALCLAAAPAHWTINAR